MRAWLGRSGRGRKRRFGAKAAGFGAGSHRFWGRSRAPCSSRGMAVTLRCASLLLRFSISPGVCSLRPPSRHSSFPRILPQIRDGSAAEPLGAVSPQRHGPAVAIAHHLPAPCCLSHPGALRGCLLLCADVLGLFGGDSGKIKSSKRSWVFCVFLAATRRAWRGELCRGRIALREALPQLSLPSPHPDSGAGPPGASCARRAPQSDLQAQIPAASRSARSFPFGPADLPRRALSRLTAPGRTRFPVSARCPRSHLIRKAPSCGAERC